MLDQPILLFDGDCGFCSRMIEFAQRVVQPQAQFVPWQFADLPALRVTAEQADREVLWISPAADRVHGGAQGIARMLIRGRRPWRYLGLILKVPPVSWAAHGVYRVVANNRHRLPGGTTACALPAHQRGANAMH
ncbi:thiol-disulfide oxidoreductase DCC family protein [Streptomyces apocyni]|uniref:thiol-disulfide oxidoreductase DCC family protein n=1 Tax=Streptomyces apocyni TaxID=2654677 RepID=UPI0012EAC968|nr:DUF393 domain-containing protein [Streptomyces apocyni]